MREKIWIIPSMKEEFWVLFKKMDCYTKANGGARGIEESKLR